MEFFEGGQYLFYSRDESGNPKYKFLSAVDVAAAFRTAPVDSGYLAPGIFRCGAAAKGEFAALFIPAGVHRLDIEDSKGSELVAYNVPLPPLVFFGIGKFFSVWAVKTAGVEAAAPLWHAPLPNVMANAAVCWGANRPPSASAQTIAKAWQLFITSPFNSHAANQKSAIAPSDVRNLLWSIAVKNSTQLRGPSVQLVRPFPLDDLQGFDCTLDQAIEDCVRGDE